MSDTFITDMESVARIYGDMFYIVRGEESEPSNAKAETEPATRVAPELAKPVQQSMARTSNEVEKNVAEKPSPQEIPTQSPQPPATGLQWRVKPTSKMLFILHQSEMKDPEQTDFLKKIVAAIGIPFETAGFGIINGEFDLRSFENMPNRYGVAFDGSLWHKRHAMAQFGDNEVFFTDRLAVLQTDKEAKMQLWNYLKNLKEALG